MDESATELEEGTMLATALKVTTEVQTGVHDLGSAAGLAAGSGAGSREDTAVPGAGAVGARELVAVDLDPATVAASIERAIARGEHREALARCARAYGGALGRLCMAFTGSQAEAEELVQETLLAAHDAFPQYRAEGSVKAFIFTIARRTCARAVERRTRREGRLRLVVSDGPGEDSQDLAIRRQRAERARAALEDLRPTEREALLLRYDSELSFREVAAACGCDEAAARKRVSRGLSRMRELLMASGHQGDDSRRARELKDEL